ncbi:hypothetical protein KSF_109940 [Reticulibacter mediterranei]|uniref:Uncharacterized protein n=1 Tax=Reticulibacter mediterranei TaxID=2778369 RepID=A0A8J3IU85_9CHLR|nr:hypothetical protein [Reticulibacter mediterranei]GHP00947.1 hypothetical protein KSF_109940 [Reticulibacter mediterranei]
MDHAMTTQFASALEHLQTSAPDPNGEPQFRYLDDPPGRSLLEAYLNRLTASARDAIFAQVPSDEDRPSGQVWLVKTLLHQWGDPDWDKREAASTKERRLKDHLKRKATLVVLTDIHTLSHTPQQFEILLSIFQTDNMMPLLIIGEPTQTRHKKPARPASCILRIHPNLRHERHKNQEKHHEGKPVL